jgi:hypothetical protein
LQHHQHIELYSIAGLLVDIVFPAGLKRGEILPSFEPFVVPAAARQKSVCSIELVFCTVTILGDRGKLRSDVSAVWGDHFRFYEQKDGYLTIIQSELGGDLWMMKSNKDFSRSVIHIQQDELLVYTGLSWLMMVAFGQTCLLHRTILIHASVVSCHGNGYVFLGKSGTGKSTHSRLWLAHIKGAALLNDDNPAIRLEEDGQTYVYGTPWSGKTDCYKSMKVPVQAFVRLKQATKNQITEKKGMDAFIGLLPSCTAIRWNKMLFTKMTDTVETIVKQVLVAELACLPNADAALLCYHETLKSNNLYRTGRNSA